MNDLEALKLKIVNSKNFKEIKKEYLLSQLSETDDILLIRDIFISKGKKIFFKGDQKRISKETLINFFMLELTPDLYKNYIIIIIDKASFLRSIKNEACLYETGFIRGVFIMGFQ